MRYRNGLTAGVLAALLAMGAAACEEGADPGVEDPAADPGAEDPNGTTEDPLLDS